MTNTNCGFKITEPTKRKKTPANVFAVCCFSAINIIIGAGKSSQNPETKLNADSFTECVNYPTADTSLLSDYNKLIFQKEYILDRLEKLHSGLDQDWDGHSGLPMEDGAYVNTRNAIMSLSGNTLSYWNLFPCPNGTFLLTTKDNSASINIGNSDFSYVAYCNAENQFKGILPYDCENFIKVVNRINKILGYEG